LNFAVKPPEAKKLPRFPVERHGQAERDYFANLGMAGEPFIGAVAVRRFKTERPVD
jgi:hypothetical protein